MEKMIHPVSGEKGFFTSENEKAIIDAVFNVNINQLLLDTSSDARGVGQ